MSTTTMTTTRVPTRTPQTVLTDYELHHSTGPATSNNSLAAAARPSHAAPLNPHGWDTTHRRVPPYRPINRERDQSEVRVYTSTAERIFIFTMFTGVFINSASAKLWRGSVGRLHDGVWKYAVGGEI